jgi:hypothetical protein
MMIVIKREIPRQVIENVFVTALEGGSNYWYFLPNKSVKAIREVVPKNVEECLSVAISKAIFEYGIEVAVHDIENRDEQLGVISLKTMESRIQKLSEEMPDDFNNEMDEDGDANSSDVWFQYIALGELIFG